VAGLYFDHNVDRRWKPPLEQSGHSVVLTRDLHLERADDALQLLTAAERGYVIVTHNEADFKLLQKAWRQWPVAIHHAGILVAPQRRWSPEEAAQRLASILLAGSPLTDELYWWTPEHDWRRYE
jgi:hypothetical protein